ncbi:hypothetical protein FOA52_001761 [Chlamydomonas sp. UWO 241]|nr:hypothetical protein FOA52_001761 [Chlamydomonas sp. UWO 241]
MGVRQRAMRVVAAVLLILTAVAAVRGQVAGGDVGALGEEQQRGAAVLDEEGQPQTAPAAGAHTHGAHGQPDEDDEPSRHYNVELGYYEVAPYDADGGGQYYYDDDGYPAQAGLHQVESGSSSGSSSAQVGPSGSGRYPEPRDDPGTGVPDGEDEYYYDEDDGEGIPDEEIAMLNVPEEFLDSEPFEERLVDAWELLLHGGASNAAPGLQALAELAADADWAVPPAAGRQLVTAPADDAQRRPAMEATHAPPSEQFLGDSDLWANTGVGACARAAFLLAAIQPLTDLLEKAGAPPPQRGGDDGLLGGSGSGSGGGGGNAGGAPLPPPPGGARGSAASPLVSLHRAAALGSVEAMLSLADRFAYGHGGAGVLPEVAVAHARLAAQLLLAEIEATADVGLAMYPEDMREAWMDQGYVPGDEENADYVLEMEGDLAARGNMDALQRIGYRKLVGQGMDPDPAAAFQDFQAAAAQGEPAAIFNLGFMHLKGIHVPQDYDRARAYFLQAAQLDVSAAHNGLGAMHWMGEGAPVNLTAAFEAFSRGAEVNNSDSLFNLGTMHLNGLGTPRDAAKAVECFERADEWGHYKAALSLAACHESAIGVPANITRALEYYRKFFTERAGWTDDIRAATDALAAGDEWAALLGLLAAAEQGSDVAAVNAGWMLRRGLGYTGPGAMQLSLRLFERAARLGHPGAQVEVATMLTAGREFGPAHGGDGGSGSEADDGRAEALAWLVKAAGSGSPEGLWHLGWAYQSGVLTGRNASRAQELYREAIQAAEAEGYLPLGVAPLLSLFQLRVESTLEPLLGEACVSRWAGAVQAALGLVPGQMLQSSRSVAPGGDSELTGEEYGGALLARVAAAAGRASVELDRWLTAAVKVAGSEDVLVALMLGALVGVLLMRHRRQVQQQHQPHQQQQHQQQRGHQERTMMEQQGQGQQ